MTDKPNAALTDDQVWEILIRLRKIDNGNPDVDTQIKIANDYLVEKKTISRIKTGKTWRVLKQRFDEQVNKQLGRGGLPAFTDDALDLIDTLGKVKAVFGLDIETPLHYGRYDWIDGTHWVSSDGVIMWESFDLYNLARNAENSGINDHPVFAGKVCELPTFRVSELMTRPLGDKFVDQHRFSTGEVKLTGEEGQVIFLKSRYMEIIERLKLDVHVAGQDLDLVYLTQTKATRQAEDTVIFAAVATLEHP